MFGEITRRRRRWYETNPAARYRLAQPVISVGSLSVGGSGKTPVVAYLAQLLLAGGERPSILSRGYRRRDRVDGVVVVRDADGLRADLSRAGDEPMMLARRLDGVAVVVSPNRHLAGRLAEMRLGCSVHLLDDGFQHLRLERDVDLLVVRPEELEQPRLLPFGRLREPIDALAHADALLVTGMASGPRTLVTELERVSKVFGIRRVTQKPRPVEPTASVPPLTPTTRVLAIAGIADPERFFADVRGTGVTVVQGLAFPDHHTFSRADITEIGHVARAQSVDVVLTTEKDLVRLSPYRPLPFAAAWIPLAIDMEREEEFRSWLFSRVGCAREARAAT